MMTPVKPVFLSKSKYMSGLQCLKRLWWDCYEPELAPPMDPGTRMILDQGTRVGEFARQRWAGGVLVENAYRQFQQAVRRTADVMAETAVPAVFEAAFEYENIRILVDILERQPDGWRLIEVKSTTSAKEYFHSDLAIQYYVLQQSGVPVSSACLMHLNRDYRYDGRAYDLDALFTLVDLTLECRRLGQEIPRRISGQWNALRRDTAPDIQAGHHCRSPYVCPYFDVCNRPKPDDWTGNLPGIRAAKVELLAARGITSIHDIPENFRLSAKQRQACEAIQTDTPFFKEGMSEELAQLQYPLCFMDFETMNPAIPPFAGMRVFDHLPFQWSVHILQQAGAEPEHYEFLAEGSDDPRKSFLTLLLEVLEQSDGHIVVYNQSFEAGRLKELGAWLPDMAPRIDAVLQRLWDLYRFMERNVYHPDFQGSYSLKYVLPALIPEMSYQDMAVGNGIAAVTAFNQLLSGTLPPRETAELRTSLLAYCQLDTLALVKLFEMLRNLPG